MPNEHWDMTGRPVSLPALHKWLAEEVPEEARSIRVAYTHLRELTVDDRLRRTNIVKLRLEARVDNLGDLLDSLEFPNVTHLEIQFYKEQHWALDEARCVWPQQQLSDFLVASKPTTLEVSGINVDANGMKSIVQGCDSIRDLIVSGEGSDECFEAGRIARRRAYEFSMQSNPGST